jgi:hypothetical protein
MPGSNINYIFKDREGGRWFASRHLGISRFDERTQQFKGYYQREGNLLKPNAKYIPSPIPANYILCMEEDPSGILLLLINGGGIALFDPKTERSRYGTTDSSHPLLRLKGISQYLRIGNRLFIATQSKQGTIIHSFSFATEQLNLLARMDTTGRLRINTIQMMPDSSLAIGSSEGLYILNRDNGQTRHYAWKGDRAHNNILGLITGIKGMLWVCTDRHIGRINQRTGEWHWLGPAEGLKPTRLFGNAFKLLHDGHIIAGSGDGLFLINPAKIGAGKTVAPVLVDFKVFGKTFPLPVPLQEAREIHLSHEQNFFSFGMSTLRFGESSNTEYSYKLEGFDKDWQPAGSDRTGQYTGVPGGTYHLLLRARTGTETWVMSPLRVRMVIGKPWWSTWLFRTLALLALLGIIGAIYFYRVKRIRKEAGLRSEYEIRLNELEMSALRTQMNPHFIFNCLNTINSYINSNQKTQANHYITRFAKLIRLILENSRQRRVPLSKELEALHLYLQLESLRFENRFSYSIESDKDLDTDNIEVPPLVLQPFVENAILHGILPRPGSGNINIRISQKDTLVIYEIEDDGIGREAAKKRNAEGALHKESHGMAITAKRIELFNRENGVNAAVAIEDLKANGEAAGTRVLIPLALVEGF